MIEVSYPIAMEIAGFTGMWTRPDSGDCPISYPAPTYSAVKGIFESILWGEAIEIVPRKVNYVRQFSTIHMLRIIAVPYEVVNH